MRFYHNFWKLYEVWKSLIDPDIKEVCLVCFNTHCNCDKPVVDVSTAFAVINYLMDINLQLSNNLSEGFIHLNEGYDRDFIYPFYKRDPKLVASFVRGSKHRNYADGQVYEELFGNPKEEGIVWGYIKDEFIPEAKYLYPHWYIYKNNKFVIDENYNL